MKKLNLTLFGFLFAILFVNTSCEKDETTKINEAKVVTEYLGDAVNTLPAMITADAINTELLTWDETMSIIDIRDSETFNAGHIKNAENVAFGDLLTYYEANNLSEKTTVAIVCFSGQTASYGASLLRMLGYTNVKALKWGMSSWNEATSGSWSSNILNTKAALMVTETGTKNTAGDMPELATGKTTGVDILRARVEETLAAGFSAATITNAVAFENSATNYTVNYWSEAHYNIGHIPGAVQYTPGSSLTYATELTTLPIDQTVVVYCYTGQTSAFVTAYLRTLGYEAKTLMYGANGMMYDVLVENGMTAFKAETEVHDYELVTE
jgi:rhodanese-related sulfurtransferase